VNFKPISTSKNQIIRWSLQPLKCFNLVISPSMWNLQHTYSCRRLNISSVGYICRWSNSGCYDRFI